MRDVSTLNPIGSAHCPQYNTEAKFYIDAAHKLGKRHLVVHYEKGGRCRRFAAQGAAPGGGGVRNLASALMRSRVHNRNRDRGGKPIQLAWPWASPPVLPEGPG